MPFCAGLELATFTFFEASSRAQMIGRIIEGPEHVNKVTITASALLRGQVRPYKLEVEGEYIGQINSAVRGGNPTLARIGREAMRLDHEFTAVSLSTASPWEKELKGGFTGFIYPAQNPAQEGPKQVLMDFYGDQGFIGYLAIRHLHEGIATSTVVIVGGVAIVVGGLIGWWIGRNQKESADLAEMHRHEEAMAALKICEWYRTSGSSTVSGKGQGSGDKPAGGEGSYSTTGSIAVHRDKLDVPAPK